MKRLKLKSPQGLMRFTKAADTMDDGVWHLTENPTGTDTTLCGIAHEGQGSPYGVKVSDRKTGQFITCPHCIAIITTCREL